MNKSVPNFEASDFLAVEEKSVNLKAFIFKYLRYWYLFIIFILLGIGAAYLYIRYTVPIYEAKSTLLIKDTQTSSEDSEDIVLEGLGFSTASKNIANEIQILKSRSLMQGVIEDLNAHISYTTKGRIRDNELYTDSPIIIDTFLRSATFRSGLFKVKVINQNSFKIIRGDKEEQHYFNKPFLHQFGTFVISKNFSGMQLLTMP